MHNLLVEGGLSFGQTDPFKPNRQQRAPYFAGTVFSHLNHDSTFITGPSAVPTVIVHHNSSEQLVLDWIDITTRVRPWVSSLGMFPLVACRCHCWLAASTPSTALFLPGCLSVILSLQPSPQTSNVRVNLLQTHTLMPPRGYDAAWYPHWRCATVYVDITLKLGNAGFADTLASTRVGHHTHTYTLRHTQHTSLYVRLLFHLLRGSKNFRWYSKALAQRYRILALSSMYPSRRASTLQSPAFSQASRPHPRLANQSKNNVLAQLIDLCGATLLAKKPFA